MIELHGDMKLEYLAFKGGFGSMKISLGIATEGGHMY